MMLCARCMHRLPASRQHVWAGSGIPKQYAAEFFGQAEFPPFDDQKSLAIAMSQHRRLGASSYLHSMDDYVLSKMRDFTHESIVDDEERERIVMYYPFYHEALSRPPFTMKQVNALWKDDKFVRMILAEQPRLIYGGRWHPHWMPPEAVRRNAKYWKIALTHLDHDFGDPERERDTEEMTKMFYAIPEDIRNDGSEENEDFKNIIRELFSRGEWHMHETPGLAPDWLALNENGHSRDPLFNWYRIGSPEDHTPFIELVKDEPYDVPASRQHVWAGSGIWENTQHNPAEHQFRQQRQDRAVALAMSQHARLGNGSQLSLMEPKLIKKVFDLELDDQEREYMSTIFPAAKRKWLDEEQIDALWTDDLFVRKLLSKFPLEILNQDKFDRLPPKNVRGNATYWNIVLRTKGHLDMFTGAALQAIPRHIRDNPSADFIPIIKEIVRQNPHKLLEKAPRWLLEDKPYWHRVFGADPFFPEPFV